MSSLWFISLVYSIHDSTEVTIQRMIEGIRRMISPNNNSSQQQEPEIPINPALKRHFELEIERHCKMLQEMEES
jgi:hypothetical protein